jgi:hypothetical protein
MFTPPVVFTLTVVLVELVVELTLVAFIEVELVALTIVTLGVIRELIFAGSWHWH